MIKKGEELKRLQDEVANHITNLYYSNQTLNIQHTNMIIRCSAGDGQARDYIKSLIKQYLINEKKIVDPEELVYLVDYIFANRWGLGHLEKYDTPDVDEIMVHGTRIIVQRKGVKEIVPEQFESETETIDIIRRCLEFDQTNDISPTNPIVETKRMDGSRVTAVIPPVGMVPYLNIRKFDSFVPTTENYLKDEIVTPEMVEVLKLLVWGRANIIVIGEMGSGKTTVLKWLVDFMQPQLIVGLLETTFEAFLHKLYPERMFVQLAEYKEFTMRRLFPVQLRQNIDVMMVGESRSYEISELLKSMTRGQSGSLGTGHSISPKQMISDFATMVLEGGSQISNLEALRHSIASSIDIVIQTRRLSSGRRVLSGIYEIKESECDFSYEIIPIFEFKVDEENPECGQFERINSITPKLKHKLNYYGCVMSDLNRVFPE